MAVQVLFFGVTADIVGRRHIQFEMQPCARAGEVFEMLVTDYPMLSSHRLHLSLNEQYATGEEILNDGDELAIFTAVSGG